MGRESLRVERVVLQRGDTYEHLEGVGDRTKLGDAHPVELSPDLGTVMLEKGVETSPALVRQEAQNDAPVLIAP